PSSTPGRCCAPDDHSVAARSTPRMSTTKTNVSPVRSLSLISPSPYPNAGGITTSTWEPTVCPSSACWNPSTTPVVANADGYPRSQLESNTLPSDHFTPVYCTKTVSPDSTTGPSPSLRSVSSTSAGGSPPSRVMVGAPSSASSTVGMPSAGCCC